jgi:hypothetical protein
VKAYAYLHRTGRERRGQLGGGRKSRRRSSESKEECVALRIDLHASVVRAGLAYDSPVPCKRLGVPVISQLVQELRRPFDVGEEERDGANRKVVSHAA